MRALLTLILAVVVMVAIPLFGAPEGCDGLLGCGADESKTWIILEIFIPLGLVIGGLTVIASKASAAPKDSARDKKAAGILLIVFSGPVNILALLLLTAITYKIITKLTPSSQADFFNSNRMLVQELLIYFTAPLLWSVWLLLRGLSLIKTGIAEDKETGLTPSRDPD